MNKWFKELISYLNLDDGVYRIKSTYGEELLFEVKDDSYLLIEECKIEQ